MASFPTKNVSCADFDLNADLKRIQNQRRLNCSKFNFSQKFHELSSLTTTAPYAICWILILTSLALVQISKTAAVYSNFDFLSKPNFEPLCTSQEEHFLESDGKESSVILEFNSGHVFNEKRKSCTRILSAPAEYGFIVRLILPKIRRGLPYQQHHSMASTMAVAPPTPAKPQPAPPPPPPPPSPNTLARSTKSTDLYKLTQQPAAGQESSKTFEERGRAAELYGASIVERRNATATATTAHNEAVLETMLERTCPLTIFSSLDPHTPQWRLDPCQLEDTAPEMEDPIRLFHGRIRIVWEHGSQLLHSKLMITVLGKGEQCRGDNKFQCLSIGDEPILCISKQLVCDGIRHCPYSVQFDSDEDYGMCWKRRHVGEILPPPNMESDIFEHFALEVFRNLFAFDAPTMPSEQTSSSKSPNTPAVTTLRKVENDLTESKNDANQSKAENGTDSVMGNSGSTTSHGRRNSTRTGLGSDFSKYGPWGYLMLGMLLCGGALLICGLWASASQHAANNEREAALQNGAAAGYSGSLDHQSNGVASPPNYEELEPPPAYSVLFPNQKAGSSATLSSLAAAAMAVPVTTVLPAAISNCSTNSTTTTTTTTPIALQTTTTTSTSTTTSPNTIPVTMVRSSVAVASLTDVATSSSTNSSQQQQPQQQPNQRS